MGRDEADSAILALAAAKEQVAASMYVIDSHPGLTALRATGLRGRTKALADEVLPKVDVLWSQFHALTEMLDRVRAVRAERSRPGDEELRKLTFLLRSPILTIGPDGMVLDGGAPGATNSTLAGLVQRLEAQVAEVTAGLAEVDAALIQLAGVFGNTTAALERVTAEAAAMGLFEEDLEECRNALAEEQEGAFADPLTAVAGRYGRPCVALDLLLSELSEQLAEYAVLRDEYPGRAAELRTAIEELSTAEEDAARACATAREKVARTGLPDARSSARGSARGLRAHLAQLDQLHREGKWKRLDFELSRVRSGIDSARKRAADLRIAADGLLERRTELRGRLEAYRAKAARLGFAEHLELSELHRAAHDLLYTSPCDLSAATRSLVTYRRYLDVLMQREQA